MFFKSNPIPKLRSVSSLNVIVFLVIFSFVISIVTGFSIALIANVKTIDFFSTASSTRVAISLFVSLFLFAVLFGYFLHKKIVIKQSMAVSEFMQKAIETKEDDIKQYLRKNKRSANLQAELFKDLLISRKISEESDEQGDTELPEKYEIKMLPNKLKNCESKGNE